MAQPLSSMATRVWYALDVEVASVAREAVEYALMEAGALGTETDEIDDKLLRVTAYFDHRPEREPVRTEVSEAMRIYELPLSSVREINVREVADRDWLGEWKKTWQPVETGPFIVAPPWTDIQNANDRIVIRIEPGMAFGTGTHETTRLCLAALEKYFAGGSFLDVGTGTGILAIAAAKLFPDARPDGRISACDTDAEAIAIARENARLNGVAKKVMFRLGTIDDSTASADVVCANLTADVIAPMLSSLLSVTCGRLILSGILDSQVEAVASRLRECGVASTFEIMQDGEWVAIIV